MFFLTGWNIIRN